MRQREKKRGCKNRDSYEVCNAKNAIKLGKNVKGKPFVTQQI